MGYGKPEAEVWMSKLIQRARKSRNGEWRRADRTAIAAQDRQSAAQARPSMK